MAPGTLADLLPVREGFAGKCAAGDGEHFEDPIGDDLMPEVVGMGVANARRRADEPFRFSHGIEYRDVKRAVIGRQLSDSPIVGEVGFERAAVPSSVKPMRKVRKR